MKTRIHNNRKISPLYTVHLGAAVIIFTAAIIFASTTTKPVLASTTDNTTSTTITTNAISPSGLELSAQPIWDELAITTDSTKINQTYRLYPSLEMAQ